MSASPAPPPAPSHTQKRPLEEHSSDAGPGDQPEAKRPALDGFKREDANDDHEAHSAEANTIDSGPPSAVQVEESTSTHPTANGDLDTNSVTENGGSIAPLDIRPIQSTSSMDVSYTDQNGQQSDETKWLHVRSIISTAEAATIIGKAGENVNSIRRVAGAKCTVSDYSRDAVERILTVSGPVDAIAKAFGLIIRTLNQEPMDKPSDTNSKSYPLRLLIPHILIGAVIGQKGHRIREIQEASGARLNASDSTLPLSTERSLVILGVADSVHIATYYVGRTLVEQLTERFGGPAASAYATRNGGPAGVVPGGMQVVPYAPQPAGGRWGNPYTNRRHPHSQVTRPESASYNTPYGHANVATPHQQSSHQAHQQSSTPMSYQNSSNYQNIGPRPPQQTAYPQGHMNPQAASMGQPQGGPAFPGQPLTQQIYIPNDMVGAIIGKGGAKINDIRQLSGSVIKINEPQDNSNERLVTITGTQECNQMALYLLYQRLESEKHRI